MQPTSVSENLQKATSTHADRLQVQYAGNKNPFLVTVILSSVQLLSMLFTAMTTDKLGRRPLTVYPYAVTVLSVLCLGIIGCFNFKSSALGSLLVSPVYEGLQVVLLTDPGLLRLSGHFFYDRCLGHRIRLRRRSTSATTSRPDIRLGTRVLELVRYHVQLLHSTYDQWRAYEVGCQDRLLVSARRPRIWFEH